MHQFAMRFAMLGLCLFSAGVAEARLCLTDIGVFEKLGMNAAPVPGGQLRITLPRESGVGVGAFNARYQIFTEELTGRINGLTITDHAGEKGTPHRVVEHWLGDNRRAYTPLLGTRTRAQVFVELRLDGQRAPLSRFLGLVMLNSPECIESNRAMFVALSDAYEHDRTVTLSLVKARLLGALVGYSGDGGNEEIRQDITLDGSLIYGVTVRRPTLVEPFPPPSAPPVLR